MALDLATIFNDPTLMLLGFEGDFARFVRMDRGTYARSIFCDHRIEPLQQPSVNVPLDPLLSELARIGFAPPRLRFIHHFAQSGSTLLARALDQPGNLVIREPLHLRQLGVAAGASGRELTEDQRAVLAFSLSMLGKRFEAGSTVVVKGNVPTSLLAGEIVDADPGQAGILLYFPLDDYCAAVLRTPNHQRWVDSVCGEIALGSDPQVGNVSSLGVAEKAAALWFSMIKRFERILATNPGMRSLDANQLFDQPGATISAASELLQAGVGLAEAQAIADGPLFASYSKNPAHAYDPATRVERREATKAAMAMELRLARQWVEQRKSEVGAPDGLDRPLIGESIPLY